ncbi:hypothetical protein ZOSMA_142G00250 [Zostera marina]|uniref:Uncharacterized protein n=1 Tax=Zostera marina TaxID=29655 RepID=A0A0K9PXJ5_ZOSMR|nr:hypothetical protein ZOSMA_142G00250 [Zostera marina]
MIQCKLSKVRQGVVLFYLVPQGNILFRSIIGPSTWCSGPMDLVSVRCLSSDSPATPPLNLSTDYSIHESITLFDHRIGPIVPKSTKLLHSHCVSKTPQKRKRIQTIMDDTIMDDPIMDDSNQVEETLPIMTRPSTSTKS